MTRPCHRPGIRLFAGAVVLAGVFTAGVARAIDPPLPVLHWGFGGQIGTTYISSNVPVHPAMPKAVAVAGGFYSSAVLTPDGRVWTWGTNAQGQLGDGTNVDRATPGTVLNLDRVVAIAAGNYHVLALRDDRTVWAWGYNQAGQLGDGSRTNRNLPVQVVGLSGVIAVAAGAHHSLAVTTDGRLYSWGSDQKGQLGVGGAPDGLRVLPVEVTALGNVAAVDAFAATSIAVLADGSVWAWGENRLGQLGDGTTVDRFSPVPNGVTNAVAVAAGGTASAALLSDGTVSTWGSNNGGMLGSGLPGNRFTPGAVVSLTDVVGVDVGFGHMIALRVDGTVWVWGGNADWGQLGLGLHIGFGTTVPLQVASVTGVRAVAAGGASSLALGYLVGEADTTPPSIACSPAPSGWQGENVTISCTAEDPESGLQNPSDASFDLSTSVEAGTEEPSASTGAFQVCDISGNCATAGPIGGIMVDRRAPDVFLTAPAGAYTFGQAVTAAFSCADGGSGVVSCSAAAPSGAPVPTDAVGAYSFSVTATDASGNSQTATTSYTVSYGICLLYDSSKAAKSGSTIPVKLRACDAAGNNLSSAALVLHASSVIQISSDASLEVLDAGDANPDSDFRFSDGTYIFNLKTTGLATGSYALMFRAGTDPVLHTAPFQVR